MHSSTSKVMAELLIVYTLGSVSVVQTGTIVTPVPITLGSIEGRMEGGTRRERRTEVREGGRED